MKGTIWRTRTAIQACKPSWDWIATYTNIYGVVVIVNQNESGWVVLRRSYMKTHGNCSMIWNEILVNSLRPDFTTAKQTYITVLLLAKCVCVWGTRRNTVTCFIFTRWIFWVKQLLHEAGRMKIWWLVMIEKQNDQGGILLDLLASVIQSVASIYVLIYFVWTKNFSPKWKRCINYSNIKDLHFSL